MATFDLDCDKEFNLFSNPYYNDHILTNFEVMMNSDVFKAGISNHHSFIQTTLKNHVLRGNAKTKPYRY